MQKKKMGRVLIQTGVFLVLLVATPLFAQSTTPSRASTSPPGPDFALQEGERVVFVGNSLFENELLYGYLELALTTRWPNQNVTFRNIGWTGDTVFGEARSYITNPPTPYELLLKQITDAHPTLVFVAYGGIEAYNGEEGLGDFSKGLNSLIDTISKLGAKTILLSPIPAFSTPTISSTDARNAMLAQYSGEIARIAAARKVVFLDVFHPMKELGSHQVLSDNGFHLNETGYYQLAGLLDQQLGGSSRTESVTIDLSKNKTATSESAKILSPASEGTLLQFEIESDCLPLPVPPRRTSRGGPARSIKITGLKKGVYLLTSSGREVVAASARQWAKGVAITQGPDFAEAERLQNRIIEKNELFFHQYRPHNRTYIIGFRSYEQGRHAEGLQELNLIIKWLEGQIALHRAPVSAHYQLSQLK